MKGLLISLFIGSTGFLYSTICAQTVSGNVESIEKHGPPGQKPPRNLYIDVHHLGPGKVSFEVVMKAHEKDLAVEKKYGVNFLKYWVDEAGGNIYCLSSSADSQSIRKTHAEAHGLLPDQIFLVSEGSYSPPNEGTDFFLDIHELGAGKVTARDVAGAHQKDLIAEKKYNVNFINYWLDEKQGVVMCLSQAPDTAAIINTHKEAHGLLPAYIVKVKPNE